MALPIQTSEEKVTIQIIFPFDRIIKPQKSCRSPSKFHLRLEGLLLLCQEKADYVTILHSLHIKCQAKHLQLD